MTLLKILIILLAALITAGISGIFGMAGGLIFMGIIATFLGVSEAMVVHGMVQSLSNGYRCFLLRSNVRWDILGYQLLGAIPAVIALAFMRVVVDKPTLFLLLGLLPFLLWLPKGWFQGNAEKPAHAMLCGAMVMGLNLTAGVAGPALDFFYVKTGLSRLQIVAVKALTMLASHLVKIVYFGLPLIAQVGLKTLPPIWVFIAVIPCVMLGTYGGTQILRRLSDVNFRRYTRYLVTAIGLIYIYRAYALGVFS